MRTITPQDYATDPDARTLVHEIADRMGLVFTDISELDIREIRISETGVEADIAERDETGKILVRDGEVVYRTVRAP